MDPCATQVSFESTPYTFDRLNILFAFLHWEMITTFFKLSSRQSIQTTRSTRVKPRIMSFSCFSWTKKQASSNAASKTYSIDHSRFTPDPPAYTEKSTATSKLSVPKKMSQSRSLSTTTRKGFEKTVHEQEPTIFQLGLPVEEAKARLSKLQALLVEHKLDY